MMKLYQQKPGPGMELLLFGLLVLLSFFLVLLVGMVLAVPLFGMELSELQRIMATQGAEGDVNIFRYLQVVNQVGIFILPALLFGILVKRNFIYYFHLEKVVLWKSLLAVFILLFTILPLINLLATFNEAIELPPFLGGVEQWMKEKEEAARQLTGRFLETTTPKGLLINLFIIGVLPAIGEELFFRGALQQIFTRWFNNVHWGIIITSVLFSALHLQFFGFLPRFLLGMIFGYLFYWSRTIWLPVFAHFINNAAAVVVAFLAARGRIDTGMEEFGNYNGDAAIIILNTALSIFVLYYIYKLEYQKAHRG
ncbi:MAG: CPBP family intramembrane metalloprotease [Bacteroidales bacterium]|nr:CPBP family intramembrane metalloprotease [Bacteroidales bacterium]